MDNKGHMIYTEEQREQHKAIVRRAVALEPNISVRRLTESIEKKDGIELGKNYIHDIIREIRKDWTNQYDEETKDVVAGRFEELCLFLIDNLREIIKEEKLVYGKDKTGIKAAIISQQNRIVALKEIRECAKSMISMRMDLGILDRHLGKLDGDVDPIRVRAIVGDLLKIKQHDDNTITINGTQELGGGTGSGESTAVVPQLS